MRTSLTDGSSVTRSVVPGGHVVLFGWTGAPTAFQVVTFTTWLRYYLTTPGRYRAIGNELAGRLLGMYVDDQERTWMDRYTYT
jgi:hypothetical protein